MDRIKNLALYILRQFFLCEWGIGLYTQWRDPISDFDFFRVGFSYFGENDYYNQWASFHITILGVVLTVRMHEGYFNRYIRRHFDVMVGED